MESAITGAPAKPKRNLVALLLATWFGCGFAPAGPGTAGSAAAVIIAAAMMTWTVVDSPWFVMAAAILLIPGIWAADTVARERQLKDPQIVVIDEVIGQFVTIAGATVLNWKSLVLAFLLFRIFDIWKPFPIRRLEGLPGGAGIIADDVMAGVYGAVVIFVAGYFRLY